MQDLWEKEISMIDIVVFHNNPDVDYFTIMWSMGLIQVQKTHLRLGIYLYIWVIL